MKFGSFSIKSTFFNNCWKVDIFKNWILNDIFRFEKWLLQVFSKSGNFQRTGGEFLRMDICRKWIILKSGYFVTAQLEYVFNNWIKLICQTTYKSLIPIISNDFNPSNFLLANENRVFLRESFLILYIGCFTGRGEVIKHKYGHI